MKLRPELALRERKKTRLDATSAQCSQSASVYLLQKAAGWHISLPGACVLYCAFICGLNSTGNVRVFRVFAPVSLSLARSLSRYSCRSDTQWRAAVPPHFNMAERPPHIYPRQHSAAMRLGGGGCACTWWGKWWLDINTFINTCLSLLFPFLTPVLRVKGLLFIYLF